MSSFDQFTYHEVQQRYWVERLTKRYQLVAAGRRSGKSEIAKRRVVDAVVNPPHSSTNYFAGAPTVAQAKRIFWNDLVQMLEPITSSTNKSDMVIETFTGAAVHIVGLDKPERIEGSPWDGGIITEIASVKQKAWAENVAPALDTIGRPGWCILEGVPEGRNWFYDLAKDVQSGKRGDAWGYYHWKSAEVLPAEMILQARLNLDELTFKQEYEAEFVVFSGLAYYNFATEAIVTKNFDDSRDIHLAFDFNTSPGIAIIIQQDEGCDYIVDEIHIPRNSNTEMICERLIVKYHDYTGSVYLYGDATGEQHKSSALVGTDWDIIRAKLTDGLSGATIIQRVPRSNPRERARVNAMNSRLKSASGDRRIFFDSRCENTIKDFEGVKVDTKTGKIDKKDQTISHISDAIGYYVDRLYPIRSIDIKKLLSGQQVVIGPKLNY